jgi:YggT family protein
MSSLNIVLDFVFRLACLLFLTRFLLQACSADFYNPISQAVVKATDTVCKPLRRILKPLHNFDFASFLMAWLVSVAGVVAFSYLAFGTAPGAIAVAWAGLIKTLMVLLQFYKWTIIIIVVASFIAQGSYHPALALLNQLVDPIMAPVRKILPSLGPLDLSPMVVLLIIILIEDILMRSFI